MAPVLDTKTISATVESNRVVVVVYSVALIVESEPVVAVIPTITVSSPSTTKSLSPVIATINPLVYAGIVTVVTPVA